MAPVTPLRRGRLRPLGRATIAMLGVAMLAVIGPAPSLAEDGMTAAELYKSLERAAEDDPRIASELRTIDRFFERHDIDLGDLSKPEPKADVQRFDGMSIRVEGFEPWTLTIHNDTEVGKAGARSDYIDHRKEALAKLVAEDGGRRIEVVVSPDRPIDVSKFAQSLDCACDLRGIVIDVWDGDAWVMETGNWDTDVDDLAKNASSIERSFRDYSRSAFDLFDGLQADDLRYTLRWARLSLPADEAAKIARNDDVLLVDPITDIADRYADDAALIRVSNAPDVFRAFAEDELDARFVPTTTKPEEGEDK